MISHDVMALIDTDNPADFFERMTQLGYSHTVILADGSIAAIMPLIFTDAIVSGITWSGYEDRWCYHKGFGGMHARMWLYDWVRKGTDEPTGWHRHPTSGRRFKGGAMYVNP